MGSGTLGVNSPSLSDLEKERKPKKPKSTKVPARRQSKRKERSAESSPHPSALNTPTASTQVAGVLIDLQGSSAGLPAALKPPTPPSPVRSALPLPDVVADGLSDLLGFTLDELVDPEVMATDSYPEDIRNILDISMKASASVVQSAPNMQEKLNRLFMEITQPEAAILANCQPIRDAMAAVEADLPDAAMSALLNVCHLDEKKAEVDAANARIAQRHAQEADQRRLDKLIAEAKAEKKKYDETAASFMTAKSSAQRLEQTKKRLEEELAKVNEQLADALTKSNAIASTLKDQKNNIGQAVAKVRDQSAKVILVPGNAKADEDLVYGITETLAKAAAALSGLGARLPGSGL